MKSQENPKPKKLQMNPPQETPPQTQGNLQEPPSTPKKYTSNSQKTWSIFKYSAKIIFLFGLFLNLKGEKNN